MILYFAFMAVVTCVIFGAIWLMSRIAKEVDATKPQVIEVPSLPQIDWFVWESQQIQTNGYAPWFDHWRYDGTDYAYPDPTPEQRRAVFLMSQERAIEQYGAERVQHVLGGVIDNLPIDMHDPAYERARAIGQDPVGWALKKKHR